MADVNNRAASGINLGGIKAAAVQGAVGSVGRERVSGYDISPVAAGVDNYLQSQRSSKAAKAKEALNRVQSEEAIGEAGIVEQANFQTDAGDEAMASASTGFQNDMGVPPSKEAYKDLAELHQFTDRIKNARAQGNPQAGLDLALIRYRKNFLAKHPEYGPEAIAATSGITGAKPSGIDANARDATEQHDREKEQDKALRDIMAARGDVLPASATFEQVASHYNMNYAPEIAAYTAADIAVKKFQADKTLDEGQREAGIKAALRITQPGNVKGAMAFFNTQLKAKGSKAARVQAIDQRLSELQTKIMEQEGLEDPAEFQKMYGHVIEVADQIKDTIMNKNSTTAMETAVKMQDAAADFQINNEFGLAPRLMQKVILPWSNILGPVIMSQFFEKSQGPGQPAKIGHQVFERFTRILAAEGGLQHLDPFGPVDDAVKLVSDPGRQKSLTREGEQAVAQLSRPAIDHFDDLTPEALAAAGDMWTRIVTSKHAAKSGTAWADVMDAMDSDRFVEFLDATGKRGAITPKTIDNTYTYLDGLLDAAQAAVVLPKTRGFSRQSGAEPARAVVPKLSYNETTQSLAVDEASLQGLTEKNRDTYIRSIRRVSQAIRVLHNKFEQGDTASDLAAEIFTKRQARPGTAGVKVSPSQMSAVEE